jgi:hypothetical protein
MVLKYSAVIIWLTSYLEVFYITYLELPSLLSDKHKIKNALNFSNYLTGSIANYLLTGYFR